jgi:glutathione S-transferase
MQLYVTYGSPYARLARIVVVEKGLEDRVEIIEAKTRMKDSPYYQINPSGRVPYLVDDTGCRDGGQPADLRLSRSSRRQTPAA